MNVLHFVEDFNKREKSRSQLASYTLNRAATLYQAIGTSPLDDRENIRAIAEFLSKEIEFARGQVVEEAVAQARAMTAGILDVAERAFARAIREAREFIGRA